MNKNVYKVIICDKAFHSYYNYTIKEIGTQIVIGLDNLKILLDAYPDSEWELVKDNGERNYYE